MTVINPRAEADARIVHAANMVCNTCNEDWSAKRDYTPEELQDLYGVLSMALVQLAKLPGGKEAREHTYARTRKELERRGRHDILSRFDAETGADRGESVELRHTIKLVSEALDAAGVPAFSPGDPDAPWPLGEPIPLDARVRLLSEARDRWRADKQPNDHRACGAVLRALGTDTDLSYGTVGYHLAKLVELGGTDGDALAGKLVNLAAEL